MNSAVLQKIEDAGVAVLTLCEGIDENEFAKSRLTRQETCRYLDILSQAAVAMPLSERALLPEIDWKAWDAISEASINDNPLLWQVINELVPATLMWLRVYQNNQPNLFASTPA